MGYIDIRDIDEAYFNAWRNYSKEEVEWFKTPTKLEHFQKRIDLLFEGKAGDQYYDKTRDFYDILKYKILNLVPTMNKELTEKVYKYLNDKYGRRKLQRIIRRCARYRIMQGRG